MVKRLSYDQQRLLQAMFSGNHAMVEELSKVVGPHQSLEVVEMADAMFPKEQSDLRRYISVPENIVEVL